MDYVCIQQDGNGGSRSVDVDVEFRQAPYAVGVPPLLVSSGVAAREVVFVQFPSDVGETQPHPSPRRQFGVVLSGIAETETTDGEIRRFSAGRVVLLEDVRGAGHATRVIEQPLTIMFVPLEDDP
jgi:hypothetical protein